MNQVVPADQPITLVIFGVSGDLATRKLLPALYWLLKADRLPPRFNVVGVARSEVTPDSLVEAATPHLGDVADDDVLARLRSLIHVTRFDSKDPSAYQPLQQTLVELEGGAERGTRLLYLSIPPAVAMPIIAAIGEAGLARPENATTRLLLEKPFGYDLASAERLDRDIAAVFSPEQVFRIDHYMAKETAQNLRVFRFQNPIIRDVWSNQCVQLIEIEASEQIGIEGRANFYEQTGALRDIVQSHLINLMALTMMEQPTSDSVEAFHAARLQLIQSISPIDPSRLNETAWRGQYDRYRQEVGRSSITETFAALKLEVDNERWRGVPVWLTTGKGLHRKRTEIRIMFCDDSPKEPNWLLLRFAPEEGIELQLRAKRPGLHKDTAAIDLQYTYPASLERQPDGYEHIILDAIEGDQTHFTTGPEVVAIWRLLEPVLRAWGSSGEGLTLYPFGSTGPVLPELPEPDRAA